MVKRDYLPNKYQRDNCLKFSVSAIK